MNGEPIADWIRDSTYVSPELREQSASVIQIESHKLIGTLVVLSVLAISIASVGLGLSIGARDIAARAEREAKDSAALSERESRLQRLEIDEMKIALQLQGMKVHEGSTP